jgi:hypothetical protein
MFVSCMRCVCVCVCVLFFFFFMLGGWLRLRGFTMALIPHPFLFCCASTGLVSYSIWASRCVSLLYILQFVLFTRCIPILHCPVICQCATTILGLRSGTTTFPPPFPHQTRYLTLSPLAFCVLRMIYCVFHVQLCAVGMYLLGNLILDNFVLGMALA